MKKTALGDTERAHAGGVTVCCNSRAQRYDNKEEGRVGVSPARADENVELVPRFQLMSPRFACVRRPNETNLTGGPPPRAKPRMRTSALSDGQIGEMQFCASAAAQGSLSKKR